MTYTFAQAKQKLAPYAGAYGLVDISGTINSAIDALAHTKTWKRMTKVLRFTVNGEYFALPQDCGSIRRAAIDSVPVSITGSEAEFLSAGSGDFDYLCEGYAPLHGLQRLGVFPTMYAPTQASQLIAYSTNVPSAALTARVRDANGDLSIVTIPCVAWAGPGTTVDPVAAAAAATAGSYLEILGVSLPDDASAYISLYGIADGAATFLSRMHPQEPVPEFTRYRVPGFSAVADASYHLLAEVSIRFLPLVDDRDPLPLPGLRALQYMVQSQALTETGEIKASEEYRVRAERELVLGESVEEERQGIIVMNPLYALSNGQVSDDWRNA